MPIAVLTGRLEISHSLLVYQFSLQYYPLVRVSQFCALQRLFCSLAHALGAIIFAVKICPHASKADSRPDYFTHKSTYAK